MSTTQATLHCSIHEVEDAQQGVKMGSSFPWKERFWFCLGQFCIHIHIFAVSQISQVFACLSAINSDKQLSSCLTYFILCTFRKTSAASFAIFLFSVAFMIEILPSLQVAEVVSRPPNARMKVRYLICVRHLAISPVLRVICEYLLVPSHFIVILPTESFHIYKSKMRRSVSAPTNVTFLPSQAMSRTEDTISTSVSPTLCLTVCPLNFRPSANKSRKDCLLLVLDRKAL